MIIEIILAWVYIEMLNFKETFPIEATVILMFKEDFCFIKIILCFI